ncbi:hypothetical protein [Legionella cardiaca]|uniref:Uncharacterized protein n=1 Tax=Legionella cardiaca TaxID=1071983 RepID=A0ABY8AVZ0_9GAMM|nr:hypothetical protein [Legionella cardiaca]WED43899.1 hypothetical protein PXX05_03700 [Legionella cardiaca]
MLKKTENTHLSPRQLEELRLRKETNGMFAPAKPGSFYEKRKELIEKYVREGLEKFDARQQDTQQMKDDELMSRMEP